MIFYPRTRQNRVSTIFLHWWLFLVEWLILTGRNQHRCPLWAAMIKGVAPSSVLPWSLLAPDPTRNRTTSRRPQWAARNRGVVPSSVVPRSLLAPASISRETHSRLPLRDAAHKGVNANSGLASASSKSGFRGSFKCCSRSFSSRRSHASIMSRSSSPSGSWNSRKTSCTTWRAKIWSAIKIWSSSSRQLSWKSLCLKRGMPISCAKRCFKAFTETSAKSTSWKTAIDSPVTAESTSSME